MTKEIGDNLASVKFVYTFVKFTACRYGLMLIGDKRK